MLKSLSVSDSDEEEDKEVLVEFVKQAVIDKRWRFKPGDIAKLKLSKVESAIKFGAVRLIPSGRDSEQKRETSSPIPDAMTGDSVSTPETEEPKRKKMSVESVFLKMEQSATLRGLHEVACAIEIGDFEESDLDRLWTKYVEERKRFGTERLALDQA